MQSTYAAANAICSFTGEAKKMQPEQPPERFFTPGKPWTFYLCICSYLDVKVFPDNAICVNCFLVMGIFRQHK